MIKYKHSICLFVTFIILVLTNTHSLASTFSTETVDGPKYIQGCPPKSIAVDTSGYPHIAYGGDHLYYTYFDGNTWQFETIDASPCAGSCASIALDTSDKVHISYYDGGNNSLKYATNTSGSWITKTVDSGGGYGCGRGDVHNSIALDSLGNVHISYCLYYNYSRGSLKYATNASGKWVIKTIGKKGKKDKYVETGEYSSIAIDKLDKVYISDSCRFYDKYNNKNIYYLMLYATNTSGSWTRETIDEITARGGTSIAIDKSNNIHISYYDGSFFANGDIKYATNSSGSWTISTIGTASSDTPSIAIDASGSAHVSYTLGDFWSATYNLKYATNVTGTWVTTTVDAGMNSSIALDTGGKAHISYYHNSSIKYVTNVLGLWNVTEVDNNFGSVGYYNSIGIDSSNKAHISYLDWSNGNLKYATNTSGSWVISTVDNSGSVSGSTDLALDTSGKVHISYLDSNGYGSNVENNLKYATNASGSWVTTTIDDSGNIYGGASIAIDPTGKVHISYYSYGNLKYATNVSGEWTITTIDSGNGVGQDPSIAVDTLGNVHISYYGNGDLKYATNVSGKWVTQTVDSLKNGQTGDNSSIAIDASGNVHISYHEIVNSRLKYATNTSGKWIKETVDKQHEDCNSLALDSSGKAHISYYFKENLWYSTNISGKWITNVVDSDKGVGIYNSIALDSFGNVHISYWDWSNYDLKYATTAASYTLENNDNTINYSK